MTDLCEQVKTVEIADSKEQEDLFVPGVEPDIACIEPVVENDDNSPDDLVTVAEVEPVDDLVTVAAVEPEQVLVLEPATVAAVEPVEDLVLEAVTVAAVEQEEDLVTVVAVEPIEDLVIVAVVEPLSLKYISSCYRRIILKVYF